MLGISKKRDRNGYLVTDKMKQVRKRIYYEEFMHRKKVWLPCICSVVVSLLCGFFGDSTLQWINSLNNLALSIIAATIFYVITDFYPNLDKVYRSKKSIADSLCIFKRDILEVMSNYCSREKNYLSEKEFLQYYLEEDVSSFSSDGKVTSEELKKIVHFRQDRLLRLHDLICRIDGTYKNLISWSIYMDGDDLSTLNDIYFNDLFAEIRRRCSYPLGCDKQNMEINLGLFKAAFYKYNFYKSGLFGLYKRYSKYVTLQNEEDVEC